MVTTILELLAILLAIVALAILAYEQWQSVPLSLGIAAVLLMLQSYVLTKRGAR